MNIVTKRQKHKYHYSHIDLSFLFLRMYFKFGSENYRDRRHISCELTYAFRIFWNIENMGAWYHVNSGTMWYFLFQPILSQNDGMGWKKGSNACWRADTEKKAQPSTTKSSSSPLPNHSQSRRQYRRETTKRTLIYLHSTPSPCDCEK
jgi:hypothetical protein